METLYALLGEGIVESRKSFIFGPFCIVYGIAAVILIFSLSSFKESRLKLFLYGMVIGCTIEYISSYIGEYFLHVKWWDYSNEFMNINGRTCLYYAVMWGFLSVILIKHFNPILDKFINNVENKISNRFLKICLASTILFMIIDGIVSCYALDNFLLRVSKNHEINIKGIDSNRISDYYSEKIFPDNIMMITYPNIIIVDDKNEDIYLENVFSDIKNYYFKIGSK